MRLQTSSSPRDFSCCYRSLNSRLRDLSNRNKLVLGGGRKLSWKYAGKRERKPQFDKRCIDIARLVMKWFRSWRADPVDFLCYIQSSRNYLTSIFLVHQGCCLCIWIRVSKCAVVFKKQPGPVPLPTWPEPGRFGGVGP